MRRSRASTFPLRRYGVAVSFVLIGAAGGLAACSGGDEAVLVTDSEAGTAPVEGVPASGRDREPVDDLAVRAPEGGGRIGAGAGAGDEPLATGAPAPPTLAPGAASASTVAAPATTTGATAAPVTAATGPVAEPASTTIQAGQDPQPAPAETVAPTTSTTVVTDITIDVGALEAGEVESFTMLNALRVSLGLGEVVREAEMDAFAREWSRKMAETQQFEHSDGPYGENIAFTSNTQLTAAQAAELFHQLWVESPEHYANMTNERYTSSGIGLYLTPNGWYGTHVFKF
jgi:uncharacterized protein YkwD